MRKWLVRCFATVLALAGSAVIADPPAALPWTAGEDFAIILASVHFGARSCETLHICSAPESTEPILTLLQRGPVSKARAGSDGPRAESPATAPWQVEDSPVKVTPPGPGMLTAKPGKIVTARFMVTSASDSVVELREIVSSPPDWTRVAAASASFRLGPRAQALRLVTFHIPADCPAGVYDLSYAVVDPAAPKVGAESGFRVTVLPELELTLRVADAPRTVVAGSEFAVRFAVSNKGNTAAITNVRARVHPDYEARAEPTDIYIHSGETKSVLVWVKTAREIQQRTTCLVIIEAITSDETGNSAAIEEVATVDIIPRVTRLMDPYHRLPSWVRLTFAADGEEAAAQVEVSGSGNIGANTTRSLSYVIRQASRNSIGRYASWNEYWLSYRGQRLEVDFGDRVYTLSPLVQRFNYGRGLGARLRISDFAAGAYYVGERADTPHRREVAAFVAYRPRSEFTLKANMVEKEAQAAAYGDGSKHIIASVQGSYSPGLSSDVEVEYGVGNEEGSGDDGYRLWAVGVLGSRLHYSIEKVHAGPKFYGYHTDTDLTLSSLQCPVKPWITLRLSYRSHSNNLRLEPEKITANSERSVTAGVSYMLRPRMRVEVDLQMFNRRDRLAPASYDYGERTAAFSLNYSLSQYTLYASAEHGYSQNDLDATRSGLTRLSVSGSFRPSQRHSYNVYARFGHSKYAEEPRRSMNLGIAGRWRLTRNLDMNLDCHVSGSPSLFEDSYRILTHSLDYSLPNRHVLELRTSVWGGRNGEKGDLAVLLSYSVPAPIPLGRNETVGTIKGRVYDAEHPRHAGIPNVIITAEGVAAVSNSKGEFEFPSLKPGPYSLQVDSKSIGLGRVTEGRSPFVVLAEGGKTATIRIGVVRSCAISGDVLMYDFEPSRAFADSGETDLHAESPALGPGEQPTEATAGDAEEARPVLVGLGRGRGLPQGARGLPDVLVEITNGEDYMTQYTSSGGKFDFAGLRPGSWTVRIFPENLPHYYVVEIDESQVDLVPGDQTHMVFRILPRHRHINIMDEGDIRLERR